MTTQEKLEFYELATKFYKDRYYELLEKMTHKETNHGK